MVADEDGGARLEVLLAADDLEADACSEAHGPLEGPSGGPLRDAVVADEAEGDGGEDAVEGADDEEAVGGEEAEEEGGGALAEG